MSKTSQRKREAYKDGYRDGFKGYPFKWKRHPFLGLYKSGHRDGEWDRFRRQVRRIYNGEDTG